MRRCNRFQLCPGLGHADIEDGFRLIAAGQDELHAQGRLSGARPAFDQVQTTTHKAAAKNVVQPCQPRRRLVAAIQILPSAETLCGEPRRDNSLIRQSVHREVKLATCFVTRSCGLPRGSCEVSRKATREQSAPTMVPQRRHFFAGQCSVWEAGAACPTGTGEKPSEKVQRVLEVGRRRNPPKDLYRRLKLWILLSGPCPRRQRGRRRRRGSSIPSCNTPSGRSHR